jgi:hypothetical protein
MGEGTYRRRGYRQAFDEQVLHEHWHNYQNHVAKTDFRLHCEVAGGAASTIRALMQSTC